MTPDFKRLCEAATKTFEDRHWMDKLEAGTSEAIVRAVLMELREVSATTADAGRWPAEDDGPIACLRAMIDHILSNSAEA